MAPSYDAGIHQAPGVAAHEHEETFLPLGVEMQSQVLVALLYKLMGARRRTPWLTSAAPPGRLLWDRTQQESHVHSSSHSFRRSWSSRDRARPWHFLYFRPELHGQGWFACFDGRCTRTGSASVSMSAASAGMLWYLVDGRLCRMSSKSIFLSISEPCTILGATLPATFHGYGAR